MKNSGIQKKSLTDLYRRRNIFIYKWAAKYSSKPWWTSVHIQHSKENGSEKAGIHGPRTFLSEVRLWTRKKYARAQDKFNAL